MKRLLFFLCALPAMCWAQLTDCVNPFIGTTNFSVCNPGAVCPGGMMQAVPFNVMGSDLNQKDKDKGWWSAPYEWHNKYFTGMAHGALSGVGCPEMGTLLVMPTAGALDVDYRHHGSEYTAEAARPGYYTTTLTKYGIRCEATATTRTAAERYTFRKGQANLLLNIGAGLTNECGGTVRRVSDTEIEGTRLLGTFCYNPQAVFPVYFVLRVGKKPTAQGCWKKQPTQGSTRGEWDPDNGKYKLYKEYKKDMAGNEIGYYMTFDAAEGEQIEVQVGMSYVSCANARLNLDTEQHGLSFDQVRKAADAQWEKALGTITVEGGTEAQRRVFYTALYHSLIHPNVLNDVNGEYPRMEDGATLRTDGTRYTVYSLWDTYRNVHQMLTLLYPDRQEQMVRSMIDMYKEWGWMPKWELYGRETWTMEGDPAIPVIADTYLKGLRGFDIETAYAAFTKSANTAGADNKMRPDVDPYIAKGYIPMGVYAADASGDNSVSHALEYYVADAALARLATALGKPADAEKYRQRSLGWRHYYSAESGTLRPITADGKFLTPFNPKDGADFSNAPGFHEGSAWNYTFYVPHDVEGMARLMGGAKKFVSKLQGVFDQGLYDPANEPDIAYPYLFARFRGEEWRTQKEVARLLDKYYKDAPDGLPGNDDCGTMSTWALFAMMGFYPDCPGEPAYTLSAPVFDKVTLHLNPKYYPKGQLVITRTGTGIVRSVRLGGKAVKGMRVQHADLVKAGTLQFTLK